MTTTSPTCGHPTLAEAIRIGAAATAPHKGEFMVPTEEGLATCAIGAIAYSLGLRGYPYKHDLFAVIDKAYPDLYRRVLHPARDLSWEWDVWNVLISLNDDYDWSRERIADWVQSLPALTPS